jgi:hypothetical protein
MTITRLPTFTQSMGKATSPSPALVLDWAELHANELRENWNRGQRHLEIRPIQPLE